MYPSKNIHNFAAGGVTVLSPYIVVAMFISALLILLLPRKYVIWVFLIPAISIPLGQTLVVGVIHLSVLRILTIAALCRVLSSRLLSGEPPQKGWNKIDRWFIAWAIVSSVIFMLRWHTGPAVINQMGSLFDTLGIYCALRFLIRDKDDILRTIRVFAVICCVIAVPMLREHVTGKNPFAVLGGLPELSQVRDGRVRAQGPFLQEILAGAFAGTLVALFVGLWAQGGAGRLLAVVGISGASVMTLTSASSTPLMCVIGAVIAFALWPLRRKMSFVRSGIVAGLIGAQLFMKAPVWFLISDVDLTGSSTSWDRAKLIDTFVHHFFDWFILGTNDNANWGFNMWDLCDGYINEAARGGLLGMILFIGIIVVCFKAIGRARKAAEGDPKVEFFVWAIAAALFSHVLGFFGIAYFDQTMVSWFVLLVMVSAVSAAPIRVEARKKKDFSFRAQNQPSDVGAWSLLPARTAWEQLDNRRRSILRRNASPREILAIES